MSYVQHQRKSSMQPVQRNCANLLWGAISTVSWLNWEGLEIVKHCLGCVYEGVCGENWVTKWGDPPSIWEVPSHSPGTWVESRGEKKEACFCISPLPPSLFPGHHDVSFPALPYPSCYDGWKPLKLWAKINVSFLKLFCHSNKKLTVV
jgi:hypothetical protein